jgi:DNA-binding TFAR19-related protein (PDSD5 family)
MAFSRMLRRVALVRTDVSEDLSVSFIKVARIGEVSSQRASVAS